MSWACEPSRLSIFGNRDRCLVYANQQDTKGAVIWTIFIMLFLYQEHLHGHIGIDTQVSAKIGPHAALSTVGDLVAW